MKIQYSQDIDALYLEVSDRTIVETDEIAPGVIVDYDAENNIAGIEILNASSNSSFERFFSEYLRKAAKEAA
jgi:uncharacterized protein YuzE